MCYRSHSICAEQPIFANNLRLYNGLLPTLRVGTLHLNPQPRSALLLLRPLSVGRFASLRFRPKNMAHHIFQSETELQNIPEAAPSSRSFSVSEKLARYGSSALSGVEHL